MSNPLIFSGNFAADKANVKSVFDEMATLEKEVETLFQEAKSYWKDDNDAKGNAFKAECEQHLTEIQDAISKVAVANEELLGELDNSMKNINGDV